MKTNLNPVTIHPSIHNGGALAATGSLRSIVARGEDSRRYRRNASLSMCISSSLFSEPSLASSFAGLFL
jgi:hypothetical protein